MPALPMTCSTNFRWDRCSPALWLKIAVIDVRNGKCSLPAQQPIRPLSERGRWVSHQTAASTSTTFGAPNLYKYQWQRWFWSVKNRSVSTSIHSISCNLVFANPPALQFGNEDPGDIKLKNIPRTLASASSLLRRCHATYFQWYCNERPMCIPEVYWIDSQKSFIRFPLKGIRATDCNWH